MMLDKHNLAQWVQPVNLNGVDFVEYDLPSYKSTVAMELLQVATRKHTRVFYIDNSIVSANVDTAQKKLRIDIAQLNAANEAIRSRIECDLDYQLKILRSFHSLDERICEIAARFQREFTAGGSAADAIVEYFDAITSFHELGVLKFCFPEEFVRAALEPALEGRADLLEELLHPFVDSILAQSQRRRYELALNKLTSEPADYQNAARKYWLEFGLLEAEDFDNRQMTVEYLDELVEKIIHRHGRKPAALESRIEKLRAAVEERRAARARAMDFLLSRLSRSNQSSANCYNGLALREALIRHEELNRSFKMRFLRDIDQIIGQMELPRFDVSIVDVVRAVS